MSKQSASYDSFSFNLHGVKISGSYDDQGHLFDVTVKAFGETETYSGAYSVDTSTGTGTFSLVSGNGNDHLGGHYSAASGGTATLIDEQGTINNHPLSYDAGGWHFA